MQRKNPALANPLICGLLAGFCCLLWGSAIPFINLGYRLFAIANEDAPSQLLFAGMRFGLAGLLTVLIASAARCRFVAPKRASGGRVVKLALVQTVAQYVFFYIGVAHTSSVEGSIILGMNAFVSILIACYLFRTERMNALKWLGGLVGTAGVVLLNWKEAGLSGAMTLEGEGFLLISMTASACSAGLIKRYGEYDDPVALSGWQFILGGVALAVAGLLAGGRLNPQRFAAWGVLLYLAALSATAYSLWAVLLRENPVSRVAVYMFLQPVFGVLLSLLLVGGEPEGARYAGALAMVCAGIALAQRGQRREA